MDVFKVESLTDLLYHNAKTRIASKQVMKALLQALESNSSQFDSVPAGILGQIIISLDLSGNMLTKSGKISPLLRMCADSLTDRVAELTREELHVIHEALEALSKQATKDVNSVQALKEGVVAALK